MSQTKLNLPGPFYIYCVQHVPSGKRYIGLTGEEFPIMRWRHHQYVARGKGKRADTPFYRAIKKHGVASFCFSIIYEAADLLEAKAAERGAIAAYGTMDEALGYNLTSGGECLPGMRHSIATKKRMSASAIIAQGREERRRRASETMKAAWADPQKRRVWESGLKKRVAAAALRRASAPPKQTNPQERRNKISAKLKGRPINAEYSARRRAENGGHWFPAPTLEKMRARTQSRKGVNVRADYAQLRRAKNGGNWHSAATKAKLKLIWSNPETRSKHAKTWALKGDLKKFGAPTAAVRAMVRDLPTDYFPRATHAG